MTPSEMKIVRSLIVVAWADGKLESQERGVVEGLLCGLGASAAEERELLHYAAQRRTIEDDVPLLELSPSERELLLANAALITHVDGTQSPAERDVLERLVRVLGFSSAEARRILAEVRESARLVGQRL